MRRQEGDWLREIGRREFREGGRLAMVATRMVVLWKDRVRKSMEGMGKEWRGEEQRGGTLRRTPTPTGRNF
uniref:Uncharacterized protein n=1 Tax=Vespula pensylvanica TaxID=30213 RepID=A0A834JTD3_VESPE|nr:hypothetical protein H0235_017013 [Vespula pensylvanica]